MINSVVLILAVQFWLGESREFLNGRRLGVGLVPPPPPDAANRNDVVVEKYFTQPLDHFNSSVKDTWQQRYQVNEDAYKTGGPVFVIIGGEGPINQKWLTYGQMYNNGVKYGALLFQPEHRFYGQSHPTKDVSDSSLRYLSSAQALADLDSFIKGMKELYKIPDAKVVVFGGSYAGNLAAWFREVYPTSSVGSVASSAPVLAEEDFVEYMETVGNSQKYFDPECYTAVSDAFEQIQQLVEKRDTETLKSLFGICGKELNYTDSYEVQSFYSSLSDAWAGATQYNTVGNSSKLASYCRIMTDSQFGDPLHRYSEWFRQTNETCASHDYKGLINLLRKDKWTSVYVVAGARQWIWQTCTEFAYYQSTDSKNQPFGYGTIGIKYLEDILCTRVFGTTSEDIARNVAASNRFYGGRSPNATNVFLLNGSIDPWHTLSIFEHDLSESSPSRYIEGTSHCYDMYDARPDDPPALTKAREEVTAAISKWLAQ